MVQPSTQVILSAADLPQPYEEDLQITCVEWLDLMERTTGVLRYCAVPNGGSRHPREAANLKKQGVRAGMTDMLVFIGSFEYYGLRAPPSKPIVLFCELKRPGSKGPLKGDQSDWQAWLQSHGFAHYVIRSLDDLQGAVHNHIPKRMRT